LAGFCQLLIIFICAAKPTQFALNLIKQREMEEIWNDFVRKTTQKKFKKKKLKTKTLNGRQSVEPPSKSYSCFERVFFGFNELHVFALPKS
jgi:hypothetical protein